MEPSKGDLKPDPEGIRARRSPSPRVSGDGDANAAEKPSPTITYRVKTPGQVLHEAVGRGDLDGSTRIIRASPDCVDARNSRGRTPLHVAADNGQNDIVKLLISKGADLNAQSHWHFTPLIFAAHTGHPRVVMTLLDAGADLEAASRDGHTALHRAALRENKNTQNLLLILLIRGANSNALTVTGLTPLQSAVSVGKLSVARILCAFGADPSFKSPDGKNAYDCARALEKDLADEMADLLSKWEECGKQTSKKLPRLAQYIKKDGQVDAPEMLSWASREGHAPLVELILDFMLKYTLEAAESKDLGRGWRPIHQAACFGHRNVAEVLLAHGSNVNSRTGTHKWTPLHLAASEGRQRTLRFLLDRGADILAVTGQAPRRAAQEGSHASEPSPGLTAFWLAANGRHPKSLEVLLHFSLGINDEKRRMAALDHHAKAHNHLKTLTGQEDDGKSSHDEENSTNPGSEVEPAISAPSILPGVDVSGTSGSFDGGLSSVPASSLQLSHSHTYNLLLGVWDYFDFKKKYDRPIKVAVLDTGLDVTHKNFKNPRLHRFSGEQPVWSSDQEPSQYDRIRACEDFTGTGPITKKDDMKDLDGHGTQVTELILRLAPRSELYIARICEGDINRGASTPSAGTDNPVKRPRPDIVAKAIDWAREQKVDIINMSFGFRDSHKEVKAALNRAVDGSKILVFAAMSNDGNNSKRAAWPARDSDLTIGVHSCDRWGKKTSGFTPRSVPGSHNFMFVGEEVITQWPEAKGGGFRLDYGTSFAAPAVAAMAALILGFAWQHICRKEREYAESLIELEELREIRGMKKVLGRISEKDDETMRYSYIHPELLWKDFSEEHAEDRIKVRRYAWDTIVEALR